MKKIILKNSYRVVIFTISDKVSRGQREDISGSIIFLILTELGFVEIFQEVLPDELSLITTKLCYYSDEKKISLIITTGGTGLFFRDITPEATAWAMERNVPGMAEVMRIEGLKYTSYSMLSRGLVVIRKQTLIVNLPGSLKSVLEGLGVIIPVLFHGLDKLGGDASDCVKYI